ncbi:putative DNA-binding protein [Shouchella shacheensis]|uniref:putative DNA-binding protein n=1 Tax=Shouchella shacheensis TaxID=1649580 RepID=UPI00073FE85E|nr:putative DNA-binding protein [Shouchella shacheensis]
MLDKTLRMNYLFDFYHALLTEKQRNYMSLYYLDDFSLGEIAEEFEVSRQAVYDNIRRTETMLEGYEQKLKLLAKFEERRILLKELRHALESGSDQRKCRVLVERVEKLE